MSDKLPDLLDKFKRHVFSPAKAGDVDIMLAEFKRLVSFLDQYVPEGPDKDALFGRLEGIALAATNVIAASDTEIIEARL